MLRLLSSGMVVDLALDHSLRKAPAAVAEAAAATAEAAAADGSSSSSSSSSSSNNNGNDSSVARRSAKEAGRWHGAPGTARLAAALSSPACRAVSLSLKGCMLTDADLVELSPPGLSPPAAAAADPAPDPTPRLKRLPQQQQQQPWPLGRLKRLALDGLDSDECHTFSADVLNAALRGAPLLCNLSMRFCDVIAAETAATAAGQPPVGGGTATATAAAAAAAAAVQQPRHAGLPAAILGLAELRSLSMHGSALGGSLPAALCALPKLERLVLSDCGLEGGWPRDPADSRGQREGRFAALAELDLRDNEGLGVGSAFPWEGLLRMGKLEVLHMGGGGWASGAVPHELARRLGSLRELGLPGCQLAGALPPSLGTLARRLQLLDLDDNDELELPPDAPGTDDGNARFATQKDTRAFLADPYFEKPAKGRALAAGGASLASLTSPPPRARRQLQQGAVALATSASEASVLFA